MQRLLPRDLGPIHFVGIGGIGMSGIAEVLYNLRYRVQGSDVSDNANVQRLRRLGITVHTGPHKAENTVGADVVVISSAVKDDNPEVIAARSRLTPVVRRAEMLAEIMRLKTSIAIGGTHGKTTTTSLVAAALDAAGLDPTVINGGIINAYGTNARVGAGEWLVAEADESDGTFTKLPASVAAVTNIDIEHLDHYGSFDALRAAFQTFIENIPFYGFAVVCLDDPEVQALVGRIQDRKLITYGFNQQADVRGENLRPNGIGTRFDVNIINRDGGEAQTLKDIKLPMFGSHNVLNALAVLAICHKMGLNMGRVLDGLRRFGGVKRRFTEVGVVDGVRIIDDYGHHPTEIAAVLQAARNLAQRNRVVAVVQPHRYSRLRDLFDDFCACFNQADTVFVAPIFAAGEQPLDGFDHDLLARGLSHHGHRDVRMIDGADDLATHILQVTTDGDIVVCLGAGSITTWANALPAKLKLLKSRGAA